ncbi:MAG: hypothetical protein ACRC6T_17355 [Sarcina sp.]
MTTFNKLIEERVSLTRLKCKVSDELETNINCDLDFYNLDEYAKWIYKKTQDTIELRKKFNIIGDRVSSCDLVSVDVPTLAIECKNLVQIALNYLNMLIEGIQEDKAKLDTFDKYIKGKKDKKTGEYVKGYKPIDMVEKINGSIKLAETLESNITKFILLIHKSGIRDEIDTFLNLKRFENKFKSGISKSRCKILLLNKLKNESEYIKSQIKYIEDLIANEKLEISFDLHYSNEFTNATIIDKFI